LASSSSSLSPASMPTAVADAILGQDLQELKRPSNEQPRSSLNSG
jgi:hypothetical protein